MSDDPVTQPPAPSAGAGPSSKRRRRRRALLALLSALSSLLFGVVALELYLRVRMPPQSDQPSCYVEDWDLGKRLKPGYQGQNFGVSLSVNSHGMRDDEATLARRPGTRRILALGDSWTFGAGVEAGQTWPDHLERLLGGPARVDVLNTGVSGYETHHEALYYERDLIKFEHDLVLVGFYPVNDVHDKTGRYDRHKAMYEFSPLLYELYTFPKRTMIHQVYNNWRRQRKLRARAERLAQAHGTRAGQFSFVDEDWTELYSDDYSGWPLVKESLASIGRTARACGVRGAVVLFPDVQDLRRYTEYCHPRVAPKLAEATRAAGLELIDLVEDFRPWIGREAEVAGAVGSTHPNGAGCEVIARAIAREVAARGLLPGQGSGTSENTRSER